jgi:hypothetical protein
MVEAATFKSKFVALRICKEWVDCCNAYQVENVWCSNWWSWECIWW